MWDDLREQIRTELEQLHSLLRTHDALLHRAAHTTPDSTELSALAALLHSFYNGIENILKRIAVEIDGALPAGEFWHRQLLEIMTKATVARGPAISPVLRDRLKEYLQFRHVFRHAYTFDLRWEKMRPLAHGCQDVLASFEAELDDFFRAEPS